MSLLGSLSQIARTLRPNFKSAIIEDDAWATHGKKYAGLAVLG